MSHEPAAVPDPEVSVGRKKTNNLKLVDVRIGEDAKDVAREVTGYTGESIPEVLTRLVLLIGRAERDRLHQEKKARETAAGEPPPLKGKGGGDQDAAS